jgi:hypothetical protein
VATAGAGGITDGITEPWKANGGGAATGLAVEAGLPGEACGAADGELHACSGGTGAAMTASNFALSSSICRTSSKLLAARAAEATAAASLLLLVAGDAVCGGGGTAGSLTASAPSYRGQ